MITSSVWEYSWMLLHTKLNCRESQLFCLSIRLAQCSTPTNKNTLFCVDKFFYCFSHDPTDSKMRVVWIRNCENISNSTKCKFFPKMWSICSHIHTFLVVRKRSQHLLYFQTISTFFLFSWKVWCHWWVCLGSKKSLQCSNTAAFSWSWESSTGEVALAGLCLNIWTRY